MCPVCHGDRFVTIRVASLTLRRCTGCGLYIGAFAESKEAGYGTIDEPAYLESIGFVRRTQSESIVAFVRSHLAQGDWLDVGCGYGYAVEAAGAAGYSARGIEPDVVAAGAARNRGIDVTHGVLCDATPGADVVSTLDVLEHLEDLDSFARLVRQKTRGLWVLKVPSSDGLFFRIAHTFRIASAVERLWQSRYEHPHRVYFNEASLHRFLEKHGFDIVATRYLQEIPTRTAVARLTLDGGTPRWKARLVQPAIAIINLVERLRDRSDALVVIAKARAH
jgi:2-polyprenyl-3-methyl-5-hydroxy-6-metoxy-1,4-benzoquinol methylase